MKRNKYLVLSTFFQRKGEAADGYTVFIEPYIRRLAEDHDVFAFGLSYGRDEHYYNFGLNAVNLKNASSVIATLLSHLDITAVLVAIDLTLLFDITKDIFGFKGNSRIIGLCAVEADPVTFDTAMKLSKYDGFIAISEFGKNEVEKAGVEAIHLPAIIDLDVFRMRTNEEKQQMKKNMGLENKTILFMNADGNERKNTGLVFESMPRILKVHPDTHFVLLTRKNSPVAWDYSELIQRFNLYKNVSVLDRTFDRREVRNLYAMSDFLVNPSKAGGLELAILEAQAVGVPVIATACTGMFENISDGKGIPLSHSYRLLDIFMNGYRYLVDVDEFSSKVIDSISNLKQNPNYYSEMIEKARKSVEKRNLEENYSRFLEVLNGRKE